MKGKVTPKLREEMVNCRKRGMSYKQIEKKFGVSRWTTTTYLRKIEQDRSYIDKSWKLAEKEAEKILLKNNFSNLLNLNEICPSPHWDWYAEKNAKRWLIDVTIDEKKSVVEKYERIPKGFTCAILHKNDNNEWKLMILNAKEIKLKI